MLWRSQPQVTFWLAQKLFFSIIDLMVAANDTSGPNWFDATRRISLGLAKTVHEFIASSPILVWLDV